jgi:hypothetical protein
VYQAHISQNASNDLPTNKNRDQHLCFIESTTNTLFNSERASLAADGINWVVDVTAGPSPLGN